jgi:hypothetical protein
MIHATTRALAYPTEPDIHDRSELFTPLMDRRSNTRRVEVPQVQQNLIKISVICTGQTKQNDINSSGPGSRFLAVYPVTVEHSSQASACFDLIRGGWRYESRLQQPDTVTLG